MKRTIDLMNMRTGERLTVGESTYLPPRKRRKIEEYGVGMSSAFFADVSRGIADGRGCKRKCSVEDARDDLLLLFRRPVKRPRLDLSVIITIQHVSPYLLADILEHISALKRPHLRRVCRSWDSVLTEKSMTMNKICVVESSKKYHQSLGEEEWNIRLHRFKQHMDDIRRVVTPSTKTIVMLFPSVKEPKDRFDLTSRLLGQLRGMMVAPRVVLVNAASHDCALLPSANGEVWERPLDLQLINFCFLIEGLHPRAKYDDDLPVLLIDKLSLNLPGSLHGNSQAILKALGRMIWPFKEAQQLEWVARHSSLLDYSYRIISFLTRRRLDLGVPLEHPDVSCEDRIKKADNFALGVIACHMLVEARRGKIPPPPILFPGA